MAKKLLSKKLQQSIHIALFFIVASLGFKATAQTVLLPGDVVIVSANADTQAIDFIPLIDIERATTVYFSNGIWDDSTRVLSGQELQVRFKENIQAGTNLHVNSMDDPRFTVSGELQLEGGTFRLFAYQKEESVHRFIFALGWGKGHIWNKNGETNTGSDIPASLKENEHSYLTLGDASNHQYFIRNGASGTQKLLLKFVSEPSYWSSNDEATFPTFGTSFNLLAPPVVLFDQSVSTVEESDSVATLNVAIYEHDGSRLSVDVIFDSLRSITSTSDFNNYTTKRLNFTGLIGDGVYEVNVPLRDDDIYEGRETGIFTLDNLTKGNFGDFLTHSLIVLDDESPEVLIAEVVNSSDGEGYVDIKNMEDGVVSLSGWSLESGDQQYVFNERAVLYPLETIRFRDSSKPTEAETSESIVVSDLRDPLLRRNGGNITLKDYEGNEIFTSQYSRVQSAKSTSIKQEDVIAENKAEDQVSEQGFQQDATTQQISLLKGNSPGWKVMVNPAGFSEAFPEKVLFSWSEEQQKFIKTGEDLAQETESEILFGYFESEEIEKFSEWQQTESTQKMVAESTKLSFTVSGTDENKNEVFDGLEGLNLVYNNLSEPFKAGRLLELIATEFPDLSLDQNVYSIHQNSMGEINFKPLDENDEVAPGAPFWVSVQSHYPATEVALDKDRLMQPSEEVPDETSVEERGLLEMTLSTEKKAETLKIHFTDEGDIKSTKDLNSYTELFLEQPDFLNIAFNQGEDYFSELTLSSGMEQSLELPVTFSTTSSGKYTLSVSVWEEIPADWEIFIEDVSNEKEYSLRKDFSINFEHALPVSNTQAENDSDSEVDGPSLDPYTTKDKFVIHIRPKGSEAENDEGTDTRPREVELHQNFPNPFNPATTISFYLPESEEVRLSVFNIVGQPVAVIAEGTMSAGEHQFEWNATDRPSGMYIYQLEVGKNVMTRKMTLVK